MPFLGVHPSLLRALAERGLTNPTPVQQAILDVPSGDQDLLVSAQTGSGKTVAFGLAMAAALLGEDERVAKTAAADGPLGLIITPTRELAIQVAGELGWLYAQTGVTFAVCVGGTSVRGEQIALHKKPHIVVGTPGRLKDHIDKAALKLGQIRAVVLDEADEMLDMGFREELEAILGATPEARRTLLFSATIPKGIALLAKKFQRNAHRIEATSGAAAHADIEHVAMMIEDRSRVAAVVNVLRYYDAPRALVFCATRDGVQRLGDELNARGFTTAILSGELSQRERNAALTALREGRAKICVATDVAARGLDLPALDLVVHADMPQNREVMVHRSGRTGRAGRHGVSVLLVPKSRRGFADRVLSTRQQPLKYEPVPAAAAIQQKDQERLFANLAEEIAAAPEAARAAATTLLATYDAADLVAVLVAAKHKDLPAVSDVVTGPVGRVRGGASAFGSRWGAEPGDARGGRETTRGARDARDLRRGRDSDPAHEARPIRSPRAGRGDEAPAFSINVGRFQKADPKWIIPLLCRRGGITKDDIGSIDVGPRETRVTIAPAAAREFAARVKTPDARDPHIRIVPV